MPAFVSRSLQAPWSKTMRSVHIEKCTWHHVFPGDEKYTAGLHWCPKNISTNAPQQNMNAILGYFIWTLFEGHVSNWQEMCSWLQMLCQEPEKGTTVNAAPPPPHGKLARKLLTQASGSKLAQTELLSPQTTAHTITVVHTASLPEHTHTATYSDLYRVWIPLSYCSCSESLCWTWCFQKSDQGIQHTYSPQ